MRCFSVAVLALATSCSSLPRLVAEDHNEILDVKVGPATTLTEQGSPFTNGLAVSRTGVVAAFYGAPDGMEYRISKDQGATWSEPIPLPDSQGPMFSGIGLREGGVIRIAGKSTIIDENTIELPLLRFTDDFSQYEVQTTTVHLPHPSNERTSPFMFFSPIFDKGKIVQLPNGDLVAPMYGYFKGDVRTRVMVAKSSDSGRTWDYLATVGHSNDTPNPELPGEFSGYAEPSLAMLNDGRLICMLRSQASHLPPDYRPLYVSFSQDSGQTWSEPQPTQPHLYNIWPTLAVLDNGVVACQYSRPDVDVAFSPDDGQTWSQRVQLGTGVPVAQGDLIQAGPNKLVAITTIGPNTNVYPITVERVIDPHPGTFVLRGRVVSARGPAIAGATVRLGPGQYDEVYRPVGEHEAPPTAVTNERGYFTLKGVERRGEAVVHAQAEGFAPSFAHVFAKPGAEPVVVALEPGKLVQGKIVDDQGQAVSGACVKIGELWHGHTDVEGDFHWPAGEGIPATAKVQLVRRGYLHQSRTMQLSQLEQPVVMQRLDYEGEAGPVVHCVRIKAAPPIEAGFDDPAWAQVPVSQAYTVTTVPSGAEEASVTARFAYDDTSFYAIVRVAPAAAGTWSQEDLLELYLAKNMNQYLDFQFAYTLGGALEGSFGWNITKSSPVHIAREADGGWTVSTAIRWPVLGADAKAGLVYTVGLSHAQVVEGASALVVPATVFRGGKLVLQ
jgi:hypothetical protein